MKRKICILLMSTFLISGCSLEYNLVINDDNTIKETVDILEKNSLIGKSMNEVNEQLDWSLIFSEDETEPGYFYKKEKILGSTQSGLKYSYNFTVDNFVQETEAFKTCYENYSLKLKEDILEIYASDFKCSLTLGNDYDLTINITVNGELINGNFHKRNNNTYIWTFNENTENYISLKVNRAEYNNSNNNQYLWGILLATGALLLVGLIILIAYIKNKNNNKM